MYSQRRSKFLPCVAWAIPNGERLAFFTRGAPILPHLLRSSELAVVNRSSMVYTTAGNSLRSRYEIL